MKIYVVPDPNETKFEQFKREAKARLNNAKEWMERNADVLVVLTPVVIGGITTLVKVCGKRANLNKEESIKNLYCYDRSLGHYWRLKRELSNSEWLSIDARKKNGERLSDILSELNVLK